MGDDRGRVDEADDTVSKGEMSELGFQCTVKI